MQCVNKVPIVRTQNHLERAGDACTRLANVRSGSLLDQTNDEADAGDQIKDGAVPNVQCQTRFSQMCAILYCWQGVMEGSMGNMIGTTASRAKITEKTRMMPYYRGPKYQSGEGTNEASSSPTILNATCPTSGSGFRPTDASPSGATS